MKKVEKVSIANISFTLDSDAYVALKRYLNSLHDYYGKDPDGGEIVADIEARITELILDEQLYTKVVSLPLVEKIVAQLGTPEEFDSEAAAEAEENEEVDATRGGKRRRAEWCFAQGTSSGASEGSIPRRLYRSREGRIFGGVCSGMAQYFDLNVAWFRLAFLLPTLSIIMGTSLNLNWLQSLAGGWTGIFFILYLVLWVSIPIAKTARQRLEARGARITPSSIRQNLQEGATTPAAKKAASVGAELLAVAGRIVLFFMKLVVAVIGFGFLVSAFAIFVAMIAVVVNPVMIGGFAELSGALVGMSMLTPMWFVALVLFCVMMPLLVCGMALLGLVFNWKLGRLFYGITLGLWLLASVFCTVVVASNARYLRDNIRGHRLELWSSEDWRSKGGRAKIREIIEDDDLQKLDITLAGDSTMLVIKKNGGENDTISLSNGKLRVDFDDNGDRGNIYIYRSADGRLRVDYPGGEKVDAKKGIEVTGKLKLEFDEDDDKPTTSDNDKARNRTPNRKKIRIIEE